MNKTELERKMLIEDFIDELLDSGEYDNRIIMEETEDYITFNDSEVEKIAVELGVSIIE